jgi:hypothetical protein
MRPPRWFLAGGLQKFPLLIECERDARSTLVFSDSCSSESGSQQRASFKIMRSSLTSRFIVRGPTSRLRASWKFLMSSELETVQPATAQLSQQRLEPFAVCAQCICNKIPGERIWPTGP